MPRYFIDTDDNETPVVDDTGNAMSGQDAARELALTALLDMASAKMPDGDHRVFSAKVLDADRVLLYRASLTLAGEWIADDRKGADETGSDAPEPGAAAAEPSPEGLS